MAPRMSYTTVLERGTEWRGEFVTEPYEAAWASEAVFFVRALADGSPTEARVQVSPDGIHWCDEGTTLSIPSCEDGLTFCRVAHFGGWLRLAGAVQDPQQTKVIVYLTLKE